jgi:hypothetical protein
MTRIDVFDSLPKRTLQRIAVFLDFNPTIPIQLYSATQKDLFDLPRERQEQWLDSHREEIYQKFAEVGSPTSTYHLSTRWDYPKIVTALLVHLGHQVSARPLAEQESQVLLEMWRRLPSVADPEALSQTLRELAARLGTTADPNAIQAEFASMEISRGCKAQIGAVEALLTLTRRKQVSGKRIVADVHRKSVLSEFVEPTWSGLFRLIPFGVVLVGVVEAAKQVYESVEEPNYGKVAPVILEIMRERLKSSLIVDRPLIAQKESQVESKDVKATSGRDEATIGYLIAKEDFWTAQKNLEVAMKSRLPFIGLYGNDKRTFGVLIGDAEEHLRLNRQVYDDLRSINKVRNSLVHPPFKSSTTLLIEVTRLSVAVSKSLDAPKL